MSGAGHPSRQAPRKQTHIAPMRIHAMRIPAGPPLRRALPEPTKRLQADERGETMRQSPARRAATQKEGGTHPVPMEPPVRKRHSQGQKEGAGARVSRSARPRAKTRVGRSRPKHRTGVLGPIEPRTTHRQPGGGILGQRPRRKRGRTSRQNSQSSAGGEASSTAEA